MNAERYLSQVRGLHATVVTMQMRVEESRRALDMLRGALPDGMPRGSHAAQALEDAVAEADALVDAYVGELARWTALRGQAADMLDRARSRIADGSAHAVRLDHVEVVERYYVNGMGRRRIARDMGYSTSNVDRLKAECLDWLDHAVDLDGYPMVPLVSE